MNRTHTLAAITVAVLSAALAGCSTEKPAEAAPEVVRGLELGHARSAQVPENMPATGTIQARESALLSAQMTGHVTSVAVREGDRVRAGQLLISLDAAAAHADVARSEANVASAQHQVALAQTQADLANSTLARYTILRDRKSVSPQEFDEVQRRAQAASDSVAAAKAQLEAANAASSGSRTTADYAHIRAPFSGVVTERRVDPGALATPGMPLLQVDREGLLQLIVTMDEATIHSVQKGMSIPVALTDMPAINLTGKVAEIDPAADPASRTFQVKIDLPPSPSLHAGMSGTALVPGNSRAAVLVPASAIVSHESIHGVWVVDANGFAVLRYITLGQPNVDQVEVLSGLSDGETVVLNPADRELGGRKIESAR